jgi:hypothetical protein
VMIDFMETPVETGVPIEFSHCVFPQVSTLLCLLATVNIETWRVRRTGELCSTVRGTTREWDAGSNVEFGQYLSPYPPVSEGEGCRLGVVSGIAESGIIHTCKGGGDVGPRDRGHRVCSLREERLSVDYIRITCSIRRDFCSEAPLPKMAPGVTDRLSPRLVKGGSTLYTNPVRNESCCRVGTTGVGYTHVHRTADPKFFCSYTRAVDARSLHQRRSFHGKCYVGIQTTTEVDSATTQTSPVMGGAGKMRESAWASEEARANATRNRNVPRWFGRGGPQWVTGLDKNFVGELGRTPDCMRGVMIAAETGHLCPWETAYLTIRSVARTNVHALGNTG